jgi:pyruvate,water dikinase
MTIHWFDDGPTETTSVGGKGSSLLEMLAAGLPVPPGFCVTAEGYRAFQQAAGLAPLVSQLAAAPDLMSPAGAASAAAPLLDHLARAVLPDALRAEIGDAYATLCDRLAGPRLVAARSSAVCEDGATASFAGIYDTYLDLEGAERVASAVLDCYRALWHPRAVQYRATRGIEQAAEEMAVVVMGMIQAEVAGVAFSANPITGERREVMINASWGLGESVVSGQVTPDHIVASKEDGRTLAYEVGDKSLEIVLDEGAGSGTVERAVEPARAAAACLDADDVAAITELARRAESHYGTPQDIEFARAGGEWYLLQSRPITGLG